MRASDRKFFPTCGTCGGPAPIGKRKCGKCISKKRMKVTTGRPVRRGANKVGIAAHKPDRSRVKRPKRQGNDRMGNRPNVVTTNWEFI